MGPIEINHQKVLEKLYILSELLHVLDLAMHQRSFFDGLWKGCFIDLNKRLGEANALGQVQSSLRCP